MLQTRGCALTLYKTMFMLLDAICTRQCLCCISKKGVQSDISRANVSIIYYKILDINHVSS